MTGPLAEFVQVPGAPASGATVPAAIRARYVTADEERVWRRVAPFMDMAWEPNRNSGADCIPPYTGASTDELDAISGKVFTGANAVYVDTSVGGPTVANFRALEPGGNLNRILTSTTSDLVRVGQNWTVVYVVEIDSLPGAPSTPYIMGGSNTGDSSWRMALYIRSDGSLRIDNRGAGGDSLDLTSAAQAGRRDLYWAAWRESATTIALGRRNATVGASASWAANKFHSSLRGEQIGSADSNANVFNNGRILFRGRCPSYMPLDNGFQDMLDALATHYGCAA